MRPREGEVLEQRQHCVQAREVDTSVALSFRAFALMQVCPHQARPEEQAAAGGRREPELRAAREEREGRDARGRRLGLPLPPHVARPCVLARCEVGRPRKAILLVRVEVVKRAAAKHHRDAAGEAIDLELAVERRVAAPVICGGADE